MKIKRNLSACCFLSGVFFAIFLREGGHPSASLLSSWHTEAYSRRPWYWWCPLSPCRPCYIYPVWLTVLRERDPPFLPLMRYCSLYILITLFTQSNSISSRRGVCLYPAGDKITRARNSRCVLRAFTFAPGVLAANTSHHLSRWNNLIIFYCTAEWPK
jgi:hypothetical protein